MDYMQYYQRVCPGMCGFPAAQYPGEDLASMYPEIYHRVYPRIKEICIRFDTPGTPGMYPYPTRQMVDRMTDDIYSSVAAEIGDYDEMRDDDRQPFGFGGGFGFGRRRFLRDLIGILLIRELLGRRGIFSF